MHMIRFKNDFISTYYLLYFFSFLSIYFFLPIVPVISILILITSYYLIIWKQRFDVVIALMLYSRCLNGFVFFHNEVAFDFINFSTNAFPLIVYFAIILGQRRAVIRKSTFGKYKFTFLFFLFLTISFLINFSTSYDLITKRYLPFAFFVLFLIVFVRDKDFDSNEMIRFFRSVLMASVVVFFFSDYLSTTRELMESDLAFSVASDSRTYSFTYFSFTRNMGPTWDHRIFAIFCYLYLLLSIVSESKYLKWDIALSAVIVITTLSRGGLLTYSLILLAYLFVVQRRLLLISVASVSAILIVFLIFSSILLPEAALEFLESFNPFSSGNALEQRGGFAAYAMKEFFHNPIFGNGVGYLSSDLSIRSIEVDNAVYNTATDAFWYILLAEMGIVGFLLYLLFLKEVFVSKNVLTIALFVGFAVQLLGTDIPDMRFYYFAILILGFMAKSKLSALFAEKNLHRPPLLLDKPQYGHKRT
jgi:hypothetical protein